MREMKDSGVPWIGEIPTGWRTEKLKYHVLQRNEKSTSKEGYIALENIESWSGRYLSTGFVPEGDTLLVKTGDILFGKLRPYLAKVFVVQNDACCSSEFLVLRSKDLDCSYLWYLLINHMFIDEVNMSTYGTKMPRVNSSFVLNSLIPLPATSEQYRIVTFLDARCADIDSILEKTRASIDEYKKLKQSVITEAVTKGIRGKRPMKDSGVEWIEEIPAVWKVCRIKHVLTPGKESIKIGPFGSALTNNVEGEGPFKIYGQWNIVNKDFSAGKNYVSKETFEALGSYMVYTGDVLISMMGTIGKCAIIPNGIQPGIMDSHVIKARLNKSLILDRYFELVFDKDNSTIIFEQMQKGKKGSIMDGLNSSIVKNLVIPCPPIAEQLEIAAYLDEKCAAIDSLIASKEALVAELESYKKSLIYEYVTGKKEVD